MRAPSVLLLVAVPLAFSSCGPQNERNYANAAVGTGVAIGWVGMYRAITKDCWARCSPGYLCNEENGLCELGECLPGCEFGTHCVRDLKGRTYCARDANSAASRSTLAISTYSDAGSAADAGSSDAEPPDAAPEATDASSDAATTPSLR